MTEDDLFLWLEDVEGERALGWVREQNARSLADLEADPRYQGLYETALQIITAEDRTRLVPPARAGLAHNPRPRRARRQGGEELGHGRNGNAAARRPALHGRAFGRRQGRLGMARVRHRVGRLRRGRLLSSGRKAERHLAR